MTPELKNTIEKAYEVFGNYKITSPLEVCTKCCLTEIEVEDLCKTPLRQLTSEMLGNYNDSARISNSTPEHYKYFLPRIMELTAFHEFPTHSSEIVFQRMTMGQDDIWKISQWTKTERNLLNEYAAAFFDDYLTNYPPDSFDSVDSIILMFGKAEFDISNLLKAWEENDSLNSIFHYADLIVNYLNYTKDSMNNSFKTKPISDQVVSWSFSSEVKNKFKPKIEPFLLEEKDQEETTLNNLGWTYSLL